MLFTVEPLRIRNVQNNLYSGTTLATSARLKRFPGGTVTNPSRYLIPCGGSSWWVPRNPWRSAASLPQAKHKGHESPRNVPRGTPRFPAHSFRLEIRLFSQGALLFTERRAHRLVCTENQIHFHLGEGDPLFHVEQPRSRTRPSSSKSVISSPYGHHSLLPLRPGPSV